MLRTDSHLLHSLKMAPLVHQRDLLIEDPEWVTISISDGDEHCRPTNTKQCVDKDGEVNFMEPLGVDHGFSIKWRRAIGQKLAEMLGLSNKGISIVVPQANF